MYKICLFVIVLGLGAPMVSLRVFVQEEVIVRTTRHTSDLPGPCHLMISEYLAPVFQNLYPVDNSVMVYRLPNIYPLPVDTDLSGGQLYPGNLSQV